MHVKEYPNKRATIVVMLSICFQGDYQALGVMSLLLIPLLCFWTPGTEEILSNPTCFLCLAEIWESYFKSKPIPKRHSFRPGKFHIVSTFRYLIRLIIINLGLQFFYFFTIIASYAYWYTETMLPVRWSVCSYFLIVDWVLICVLLFPLVYYSHLLISGRQHGNVFLNNNKKKK